MPVDTNRIPELLLQIAGSAIEENQARSEFRNLALRIPGAIGVGHVLFQNDAWDLKPQHVTGRCPRRSDFQEELAGLCQSAFERRSIQIRRIAGEFRAVMFLAPIPVFGGEPEVLILLVESSDPVNENTDAQTEKERRAEIQTKKSEPSSVKQEDKSVQVRRLLESIAGGLTLWKQNVAARSGDWKLASMAAVIDLTSRIEQADDFDSACRVLVNEFSRHTGCPNVAVGWISDNDIRLKAISGEAKVAHRSEVVQAIEQTLKESLVRRQPGRWSYQGAGSDEPLLLLHKRLAHVLGVESILSWPLETVDGDRIGVWLFAGPESVLLADRFQRLVRVAAPRVGTTLSLVARSSPNRFSRALQHMQTFLASKTALVVLALMLVLSLLMLIPFHYQVRARVTAQPEFRRFAVAPFEGQIESTFKRVGDEVQQNELLAKFDGRQLRWQLLSTTAEKERAVREREVELSAQNAAAAMLAELEMQSLEAEQVALEHKLTQLEIRSPAKGVVLSASHDRQAAAAVGIGEPLFEIGSYHPIIIELSIPADDVGHVRTGSPVRIWMEGQGESIDAKVESIRPVSETRLSQNVFIAEVVIDNETGALRPGMVGKARIECDKHALGWNLFHKPWNFVRSQVAW